MSGAAAAHRFGERRDPVDLRVQEEFLEPARDALGAQAWEAAAAEGAALGFRDAIAYAIGEQAWRHEE